MSARISSQRSAERPRLIPRKVLFVDEDSKDLRYCAGILQQRGYDIRTCASYADGVCCLECESFDFIVLSQGSPEFEGRSVLERAMEIDRRMPILVVTRCHDMKCYLEAMQLGALDYVEKPLVPSVIAQLVETHLRPRAAAARNVGSARRF